MPHLSFEYSPDLRNQCDLGDFARSLRDAMLETGVFPLAGIRVRGHACDISVVADESADFHFIHMTCKIGTGRDEPTRIAATEAIYAAAENWVGAHLANVPLALSLTLDEMNPATSINRRNTIRDHMVKVAK